MPNPTNQDFDLLISELAKADERHGDSPGTADGSTIHDLKAELDTLELELRAESPIDEYEKEQECQRAVQIVEQLYRDVQPHLETIIDEQTIALGKIPGGWRGARRQDLYGEHASEFSQASPKARTRF